MEKAALKTKGADPDPDKIIRIMPWPGIVARFAGVLADTARELGRGPSSYLRAAVLPDRLADWFWLRLTKLVATSIAHPIETIRGAAAGDTIYIKRHRRYSTILMASAVAHGVLIAYVAYLAFFSQFAHLRVVNRAYKKFDPDTVLTKLYYPPQMLRPAPSGPSMSLEEIRARAEKRKQELALAREKAERERQAKEEAERKAAEEAAKVAEQNKAAPTKFGEINIAPIKDTVGNLYKLFEAGGLDISEANFSVLAGFKVMPDGSFENIRIITSSQSKIIDRNALEILSNIGESHALGPVAVLTSSTISLDLNDQIARIRIVAFAPTPEIAKEKAGLLKALFWALRMKEKSPDLGQLLRLIEVRSDGKRVLTELTVPREKAAEMFRAWVANPAAPPQ